MFRAENLGLNRIVENAGQEGECPFHGVTKDYPHIRYARLHYTHKSSKKKNSYGIGMIIILWPQVTTV